MPCKRHTRKYTNALTFFVFDNLRGLEEALDQLELIDDLREVFVGRFLRHVDLAVELFGERFQLLVQTVAQLLQRNADALCCQKAMESMAIDRESGKKLLVGRRPRLDEFANSVAIYGSIYSPGTASSNGANATF